jgi:hypothetical protein
MSRIISPIRSSDRLPIRAATEPKENDRPSYSAWETRLRSDRFRMRITHARDTAGACTGPDESVGRVVSLAVAVAVAVYEDKS